MEIWFIDDNLVVIVEVCFCFFDGWLGGGMCRVRAVYDGLK